MCGLDFIPDEDFILFFEDWHDPVYKLDRMFTQLLNIDKFKKNHKATCCRVLTAGMDMASDARKAHCVNMVDECSKMLEEIIKVKV